MVSREDLAKKHISYTSINEVKEICAPMFRYLNINRFTYAVYYPDSHYMLSTSEWSKHWFTKYPRTTIKDNSKVPPNCLFWDEDCIERGYMSYEAIIDRQESFGLYHSAYMPIKRNDHWELWIFSAPKENHQIIDTYVNKFDLLEQFVMYFKEKACKLIQQAKANSIIPSRIQHIFSYSDADSELYTENQKRFLREIEHKKFYVFGNNGEIGLTKREFEALKCNAQGMTAKEIARNLNISPRTVEIYLDRVKQKLGVFNRHHLTKIFFDNYKMKS